MTIIAFEFIIRSIFISAITRVSNEAFDKLAVFMLCIGGVIFTIYGVRKIVRFMRKKFDDEPF